MNQFIALTVGKAIALRDKFTRLRFPSTGINEHFGFAPTRLGTKSLYKLDMANQDDRPLLADFGRQRHAVYWPLPTHTAGQPCANDAPSVQLPHRRVWFDQASFAASSSAVML